jgi:hypothetical protein
MKQLIILSRDTVLAETEHDEYTRIWNQVPGNSHTVFNISIDRKIIVLNGPFISGSYSEDDGDFISEYLRISFPNVIKSINTDCQTGIIYHSTQRNLQERDFKDMLFNDKISFIERLSTSNAVFYRIFLEQCAILIGNELQLRIEAFDTLWQYNEKKDEKIERMKTDFLYLIYNDKYPSIIPDEIIQTPKVESLYLWFKENPYNKQFDIDGIESPAAEEQRSKLRLLRDSLLANN